MDAAIHDARSALRRKAAARDRRFRNMSSFAAGLLIIGIIAMTLAPIIIVFVEAAR